MHIESIPIERINPAAYNPRIDLQPGDPDYDRLQRSMDEFGFVEPLVWNRRTGNLVGGHQRLKILAAQGAGRVDVSVVDLPPEREQALNVALNKIGGDWDERKLADLLTGLAEIPDFDVSLTGFDSTEITHLLDKLEALGDEDDFDLGDALEAAESKPPVTAPGELLELGRHRLLCGDAAKSEDVERLLEGARADLVFTDPPYNVNYYGGNRPTPRARPKPARSWARIYMDDLVCCPRNNLTIRGSRL
jgi:ParB-like chromosome segregation protein Spo0J